LILTTQAFTNQDKDQHAPSDNGKVHLKKGRVVRERFNYEELKCGGLVGWKYLPLLSEVLCFTYPLLGSLKLGLPQETLV
jgi:hypothetical protein